MLTHAHVAFAQVQLGGDAALSALIESIPVGSPSFVDSLRCDDVHSLDADIAVIGVPYGVPYDMPASTSASGFAPSAIREQSMRFARFLTHYDFDFGGELFAGRAVKIVDCGDVAMVPGNYEENQRRTTAVISTILDRGAIPIVLGGDHSIPIPVMRAYEGRESMFVVQIDAHLDFRDEIDGVREGLSSPMRRASEMSWVSGLAQIGLRGVGSARQQEFEAATAYGSIIVRAEELHSIGIDEVLSRIPASEQYYITFDADGLDPGIAPGVGPPRPGGVTYALSFGGLSYFEATNLLKGIAAKGRVVGFDIVEIVPSADVANMTSLVAARLILNLIGALAHAGQIGGH